MSHFTIDEWRKLPLVLRQRWWRETDYSTLQPNEQLAADIRAALEGNMTTEENGKPADDPKPEGEPKPAEAPPAEEKPPVEDPPKEGTEAA